MEVQHNMEAIMSNRYKDNPNLSKSLDKLSSGYRINPTADNAAGLAVSEKMNAQLNALKQELVNIQNGISMFSTFEGALLEIDSILARIKSIAEKSANEGGEEQLDRAAIQIEYEQLISEIDSIAQTDYNGVKALSGEKSAEGESANTLEDINATASGLGLVLPEVNLLTRENAAAALEIIGIAIHSVSDIRTEFGKLFNRLEHKENNLNQTIENLSSAESRIRDTDMAKERENFLKNQTQSQIAQAMLERGNKSAQGTLNLLQ
jgi:flagellin